MMEMTDEDPSNILTSTKIVGIAVGHKAKWILAARIRAMLLSANEDDKDDSVCRSL